jgi:phage shock protein C
MNKRLYRNTNNKMLAGVCSGLADYFNVDPTIIRLAWILLVCFAGTGVLAYIIAMLVIPPQYVIK